MFSRCNFDSVINSCLSIILSIFKYGAQNRNFKYVLCVFLRKVLQMDIKLYDDDDDSDDEDYWDDEDDEE